MQAPKITAGKAPSAAGDRSRPEGPSPGAPPVRRPFRAFLRRQAGLVGEGEPVPEAGPAARPAVNDLAARELRAREPTLIEHRPAARPAAVPPMVARVLLGERAWAREARLELRGGVLAGTAIHLVSRAGGVEVRLGAPSEPARLALAAVIDRVGHELRSRGIVMRAGRALESGSKDGGRGGDARRGT